MDEDTAGLDGRRARKEKRVSKERRKRERERAREKSYLQKPQRKRGNRQ